MLLDNADVTLDVFPTPLPLLRQGHIRRRVGSKSSGTALAAYLLDASRGNQISELIPASAAAAAFTCNHPDYSGRRAVINLFARMKADHCLRGGCARNRSSSRWRAADMTCTKKLVDKGTKGTGTGADLHPLRSIPALPSTLWSYTVGEMLFDTMVLPHGKKTAAGYDAETLESLREYPLVEDRFAVPRLPEAEPTQRRVCSRLA